MQVLQIVSTARSCSTGGTVHTCTSHHMPVARALCGLTEQCYRRFSEAFLSQKLQDVLVRFHETLECVRCTCGLQMAKTCSMPLSCCVHITGSCPALSIQAARQADRKFAQAPQRHSVEHAWRVNKCQQLGMQSLAQTLYSFDHWEWPA